MACFGVLILLLLAFVPLAQMLLGNGPNSFRKLLRLDIAAFFVITAGFAGAFAVARWDLGVGLILLPITLPMALVLAWLGRYVLEDISIQFRHRHTPRNAEVDLAFLDARLAEAEEPITAELADESPVQDEPPQPT